MIHSQTKALLLFIIIANLVVIAVFNEVNLFTLGTSLVSAGLALLNDRLSS